MSSPNPMRSRILAHATFALACAASTAAQVPWTPHLGEPPTGFVPAEPTYTKLGFAADGVIGLATHDMRGRRVTVTWKRFGPDLALYQTFATSYWPTAVSARRTDELIVAGKRRSGNTVIERWTFEKPRVVDVGAGSARLEAATVLRIDTLSDEAVQGRDIVLRLIAKPGAAQSILVQFHDSRDLCDLTWSGTAPELRLVASATSHPALRASFTSWWSRDHRARGHVVVLHDEALVDSTFVLVDADRDGSVERTMSVTDAAWLSEDWADETNYNP